MSENILLAYSNKATGATLSGGQWESLLPLTNLKDGRLGKVARSGTASLYNTQFRFDLGANYTLRALALVNHNLSTGALWRARTTDATLDMEFVGPTSMRPRTLTTSGGANGTRVNIYGAIEAASCPRYDYSPVNLASGTATQTISNVPAGTYVLIPTGSNAAVMATGTTVSNTGTIGTTTYPTFVVVNATGNVTLTVLSAATAIHFRESLGLLVEEARTNLLLGSQEVNISMAWSYSTNVVVTTNAVNAPDGTTTADLITRSSAAAAYIGQPVVKAATGLVYVFTDYVKKSVGDYCALRLQGAYPSRSDAIFNLQTGALVSATSTGSFGSPAVSIELGKDGWYRVTLAAVSDTANEVAAYVGFNSNGVQVDAVDSAANSAGYVWGAQLEVGSFPTTYIPTTSAAVTRTADSVSITGSNFTSWFSAAAGTFCAEADATLSSVDGFVLQADDGSTNNRFSLYRRGADESGALYVESGGAAQAFMPTVGDWDTAPPRRIAGAYAVNDVAASVNGGAVVTDTSVTLPASPTTLRIGSVPGGGHLNGHIRRITYWPTRRTNAELQTITTSGPDALGIDTGWQNALRMTFHGDTPANWGEQYPLIATFDPTTVRYGTVEIEDNANPDGYVELGQLFVAGGFQPEHNAEYQGYGDGRTDLSSSVKSVGGQKYSTARRRPRTVDFNFPILTPAEGDHLDEMMAEVGTTEDVLYVPDPADAAKSQRYGFLGTLRELTPLEYPFFDKRAMPLRLEQKL